MRLTGHLRIWPNTGNGARKTCPIGWVMGSFEYLDLIFAPDGIDRFEDAWDRHIDIEGFPVCHIDDIIASKAAANRVRDRESLPRLRSFREYWKSKQRG